MQQKLCCSLPWLFGLFLSSLVASVIEVREKERENCDNMKISKKTEKKLRGFELLGYLFPGR